MKHRHLILSLILLLLVTLGFMACGKGNGKMIISVTDTNGSPLWGAKVVSESQPEGQLKIDGITSQEAGGVVFDGIKSGTYQIQVSRYDYAPQTLEVSIPSGGSKTLVVQLFLASPPPVT